MMKSIQKGFTLVELLIVVIILAILAAIVVPQFSSSTDEAKLSSLKATLSAIRSGINLYYQQHGAYPSVALATGDADCTATKGTGLANTEASFNDQMTRYTKQDGAACSSKMGTLYTFGPYMKEVLPADPIKGVSTLTIITTGDLNMIADGVAGGWKYDNVTGRFIMNHTSYDDI